MVAKKTTSRAGGRKKTSTKKTTSVKTTVKKKSGTVFKGKKKSALAQVGKVKKLTRRLRDKPVHDFSALDPDSLKLAYRRDRLMSVVEHDFYMAKNTYISVMSAAGPKSIMGAFSPASKDRMYQCKTNQRGHITIQYFIKVKFPKKMMQTSLHKAASALGFRTKTKLESAGRRISSLESTIQASRLYKKVGGDEILIVEQFGSKHSGILITIVLYKDEINKLFANETFSVAKKTKTIGDICRQFPKSFPADFGELTK